MEANNIKFNDSDPSSANQNNEMYYDEPDDTYEYDDYDDDNDDDDDDDNNDNKNNAIQTSLKKIEGRLLNIVIAMVFVGFMGVISVILGIFVGRDVDPEDYYGTYYGVNDSCYYTYYITEEGAYMEYNAGFDFTGTQRVDFIDIEYVAPQEAQEKFPNPEFEGYDALLLYISETEAHVLWVTQNDPYAFVINASGLELTNEPHNFKEDMNDSEDYYKTYISNDINKITFNKNGTAQFTLNGEEKTYKFAFVNYEWSKRWLRNPIEGYYALIVYENTNAIYVFDIEDSNTIWRGEYEFVAMQSDLDVGKDVDPEDYYGTYYGVSDSCYYTYYITEEGAYKEYNAGFDFTKTQRIDFIDIKYVAPKEAQKKFPNPEFEGYDALLLYTSETEVNVLWVTQNDPYAFVINASGLELTTEPHNFKEDMNDSEDYYKTYVYSDSNKITFNKNGTAQFTLNGEGKTYKFAFVNYEWSKRWLKNPIEGYYALIVYENTNAIYVFDIEDSNTIWFGEYEFVAM